MLYYQDTSRFVTPCGDIFDKIIFWKILPEKDVIDVN